MKLTSLSMAALCALATLPAAAQFVPGNQAVTTTPAGKRMVTPPVPAMAAKPCAVDAKCPSGSWYMVETEQGLRECTELYARPTTCRPSTFGAQKLARLWIAKVGDKWLGCQYPDLGSKCVDLYARPPANLPYDAIQ